MQTRLIIGGVLVVSASALGGVYFFVGGEKTPADEDSGARYAMAQEPRVDADSFVPIEVEAVERRVPEAQQRSGQRDTGGFGRGDFAARMAQFDLDGDGFLSDEEREAMRQARRAEMLARFDLDGDGEISREERLAARQSRFEDSDRGQALMRQFDADGDGVLDETEQAAMDAYIQEQQDARRAEQLAQYDADGDGELSQEERQVQRDEQRARWADVRQDAAAEFDADGDGVLNIEEQQNAINAFLEQREIDRFINRYDSDGDGRMGSGDYDAFVNDYNNSDPRADVNRDGVVDLQDLIAYRDMVTRAGN